MKVLLLFIAAILWTALIGGCFFVDTLGFSENWGLLCGFLTPPVIALLWAIFFGRKNSNNASTKGGRNQISDFKTKDTLILHLDEIYKCYLELKNCRFSDKLLKITIYSMPNGDMRYTLISIQFDDGPLCLRYIKNDFIRELYEVGYDEDFRIYKSVACETDSLRSLEKKLDIFLKEYKEKNAEKGEFLDLIKVVHHS